MAKLEEAHAEVVRGLQRHMPEVAWAEVWRSQDTDHPHFRLGAANEPLVATVRSVKLKNFPAKLVLTFVCLGEVYRRGRLIAHRVEYQYIGKPDIVRRIDGLFTGVAHWRSGLLGTQTDAEQRWMDAAALGREIAAITGDGATVPERQTSDELEPTILWTQLGDPEERPGTITSQRIVCRADGLLACHLILDREAVLGLAKLLARREADL